MKGISDPVKNCNLRVSILWPLISNFSLKRPRIVGKTFPNVFLPIEVELNLVNLCMNRALLYSYNIFENIFVTLHFHNNFKSHNRNVNFLWRHKKDEPLHESISDKEGFFRIIALQISFPIPLTGHQPNNLRKRGKSDTNNKPWADHLGR